MDLIDSMTRRALAFPMHRKHWAPPNAPRYRWATVGCTQGWFHVDDLERHRAIPGPGVIVRYLPLPQPSNGGW